MSVESVTQYRLRCDLCHRCFGESLLVVGSPPRLFSSPADASSAAVRQGWRVYVTDHWHCASCIVMLGRREPRPTSKQEVGPLSPMEQALLMHGMKVSA